MTVENADVVTEDQIVETPDDDHPDDEHQDDAETFPREYVEKLRGEAKGHRQRAEAAEKRNDELSRALWTTRVQATGKLADVSDLEYNADLLDDADALGAAIDDLVTRKPHLAARKISGAVGAGVHGKTEQPFSILGRLQRSV